MKPAFLMEFLNVPASRETEWNAWLDNTHLPARLAVPGIFSIQRFIAIEGDRRYFNFLGLDDIGAISSERYLKPREAGISEADASSSFVAMTATAPDILCGIYSQFYPQEEVYREPGAATILVIGHDISPEHEDEYHAWYETEHIPIHLQLPGFLHAYRFVAIQDELLPGNEVNGPKYITMYEVENETAFRTPEYEMSRQSPWTHWMRRFYTQCFRSIFRRM